MIILGHFHSSLVYSIPYQSTVTQFYVEMGTKKNFRCGYGWVVTWFKRNVENTPLRTSVERASSPFGSEHSDAKVSVDLQSGLCDLFKSSQAWEKLYNSEQGIILFATYLRYRQAVPFVPWAKGFLRWWKFLATQLSSWKHAIPRKHIVRCWDHLSRQFVTCNLQ